MPASVRKKALIFLLACLAWVQMSESSNDSVVMDLKSPNIQPRALLGQYTNDRKANSDRLEENRNNASSILNFPHNLEIVLQVLKTLKNKQCVEDVTTAVKAIANEERWTLEMFDSFPKFPTGILYGNYYQLGNFDECLNVVQPKEISPIRGQYCLADVKLLKKNETLTTHRNRFQYEEKVIHWGICLPSTCTAYDASAFVREIFTSIATNIGPVDVYVNERNCQTSDWQPFSTGEIVYGCVIGIFVIFVLLATGFHYWYIRQRKRCVVYSVERAKADSVSMKRDIIFCFSLIRNVGKFLHTKPSELNLECIAGIKFISMIIIINGHSLVFIFGGPLENLNFISYISLRVENSLFSNSVLLVDTFLLIGGFLLCRLLLIELDKRKGKFNVLILYIGRYVRLTPSYAIIIFLYVTLLYRLGGGPLWNAKVQVERERCMDSWWTNLLYLNNYINTDSLCMFQSWYLAVDYHLFIIAPALIYLLWMKRKVGEVVLLLSVLATVAIPFTLTFINNYDPTFLAYAPEVTDLTKNNYFVNVYIKTHMRASSYIIGVALGYLIHRLQSSGTKMKSYVICSGWCLATLFGLISMTSIVIFFNQNHQSSALESAIYAAFHRVSWCLAISWVILVCVTDNANLVNKFLSWKVFIPLSRLTYCAYLVNGLIEIYSIGTMQQPQYLSIYELVIKCLAHIVLTFFFAFLLCIFFESPIHGLEKRLKTLERRKDERPSDLHIQPVEES